jgi:hypothetical protein
MFVGMVKRYFCTPSKANVMIVTLLWLVSKNIYIFLSISLI